jgi:hypothetical protein
MTTMTKTKVRVSRSLLSYCQEMAHRVDEARDEKIRVSANTFKVPFPVRKDIPAPERAGLLTAPRIEMLDAEIYLRDGETDVLILINVSDVFGIEYIYVTLRDNAENLLESGYAMFAECEGHWAYIPCEPLTIGTSVTVRAVAVDALGGLGIAQETVTITDGYPGTSPDLMAYGDNR